MKEKRNISVSQVIAPDAPPEVLRAHTIADTIKALCRHGAIEILDSAARNAVAKDLGVPALWLEAAQGEGIDDPRVDLDLLHEWREWFARMAPAGKGA